MLITLYARKEATTDTVALTHGQSHRKDTVLYEDAACTKPKARFTWFSSNSPRRGQSRVTVNCWPWNLQWV